MTTRFKTFKQIVKLIGFLGLLIITAHETYVCFTRYFDYPKYTSNQLFDQSQVDFPSFTLCNNVHKGYRVDLLEVSLVL